MISDFVRLSFSNIKRNYKNKRQIVVFTILLSLLIIDIIFIKNFNGYFNSAISYNIDARTFNIYNANGTLDDVKENLKDVKHISEIYSSRYHYTWGDSNINFNGLDGSVEFYYGTENTAPKSVVGKNIKDVQKGEIICPYNFYPDSSVYDIEIDESKYIKPDQVLNKEFTFTFETYVDNESNAFEYGTPVTKTYKIVGLYDSKAVFNLNNYCYMTLDDLKDLESSKVVSFYGSSDEKTLNIVVDKQKNVAKVQKALFSKGYDYNDVLLEIDGKVVYPIQFASYLFLIVIIISVMLIFRNYLKKKYLNDTKSIGILRVCGFTEKQVFIKEVIENSIILTISYVIGSVLAFVVFVILKNNYLGKISFVYNLSFHVLTIIFTYIVLLVITIGIVYKLLSKKREPIINTLKEE